MIDEQEVKSYENDLNSFDARVRRNTIAELRELHRTRKVRVEAAGDWHNMHCHSFFSYNGWGYSPSRIAWLAKRSGWFAAGLVDFDVLDGVEEFLQATAHLNVRASAGMETRVFFEDLREVEINSPGEPGVAYHMGVGFTSGTVPPEQEAFARQLRATAAERTRRIVSLVNPALEEIALDFDADAGALTPNGNVTERHVCEAYRRKAEAVYPDRAARAAYWAGKLGLAPDKIAEVVDSPAKLEAAIRARMMKKGGPGYIPADPASFPAIRDMNRFTLACGAIPSMAWLTGQSAGEADPGRLLDLHLKNGAVMVNFVPDRNWNVTDQAKSQQLVHAMNLFIQAAVERDMPVMVGTEMNAPGLKAVDDFDCPALAPHLEEFINGAAVAHAHTLLAPYGRGYMSDWAKAEFATFADKNAWFGRFGVRVKPVDFALHKDELPGDAEAIDRVFEIK